jgi:hypothetical protein
MEHYLLARPTGEATRKLIREVTHGAASEADFVRKGFTAFMSLPEYQLS